MSDLYADTAAAVRAVLDEHAATVERLERETLARIAAIADPVGLDDDVIDVEPIEENDSDRAAHATEGRGMFGYGPRHSEQSPVGQTIRIDHCRHDDRENHVGMLGHFEPRTHFSDSDLVIRLNDGGARLERFAHNWTVIA